MAAPTIFLLLLLSAAAAAASTTHVHRRGHTHRGGAPASSPPQQPGLAAAADTPIEILYACNATRFPAACISTLSGAGDLPPSPTPIDLILAASAASSAGISTAAAAVIAIQSSAAAAGNLNLTNAARDCVELLSMSSRRLNLSVAALSSSSSSIPDAHTFSGAALLYQYDCWSALKYVNSSHQISDAMSFIFNLTVSTSNALSMIFNLRRFGPQISLWSSPQTERDGFWCFSAAESSRRSRSRSTADYLLSPPDAIVCSGAGAGDCKHGSVQSAVDSAPASSGGRRFVIYIKEGVYEEKVRVPYEKEGITFVGDGMGKTVITGSVSADIAGVSTYDTATVAVMGDRFAAFNLTIRNTAGPVAHQAVAFRSDSDLSVAESVEFAGHQDTLYAHSLRQYYRGCVVSGTVDFVFGNSAAVFESCRILAVPRQVKPDRGESDAVSAQGRTDPAQATGFVFRGCAVNGSEEYVEMYLRRPEVHRLYLGRPWKEFSRTVFIGCYMEGVVRPEGWLAWDGEFALATLFYGEARSSGAGAAAAAGGRRVKWSSVVPPEHEDVYSLQNFIQGDEWVPQLP